MAIAPRDVRNFRDYLICAICLDTIKDPRKLPCDHSFCLSCLIRHITENRSRYDSSFHCPSCRSTTKAEIRRVSSATAEEIANCFPQNAFLIDMEEKVSAYESGFISCETHPGVPSQYVCITDLTLLCSACAAETHRSAECSVVGVSKAHSHLGGKLKTMEELCDNKINDATNLLSEEEKTKRLDMIKANTLKEIDDFMTKIGKTVKKIYEDADRAKKSVETIQLPSSYEDNISKHLTKLREHKSKLAKLRDTCTNDSFGQTIQEMTRIKNDISQIDPLASVPQSALAKNSKTEAVTNERKYKNLVGDISQKFGWCTYRPLELIF